VRWWCVPRGLCAVVCAVANASVSVVTAPVLLSRRKTMQSVPAHVLCLCAGTTTELIAKLQKLEKSAAVGDKSKTKPARVLSNVVSAVAAFKGPRLVTAMLAAFGKCWGRIWMWRGPCFSLRLHWGRESCEPGPGSRVLMSPCPPPIGFGTHRVLSGPQSPSAARSRSMSPLRTPSDGEPKAKVMKSPLQAGGAGAGRSFGCVSMRSLTTGHARTVALGLSPIGCSPLWATKTLLGLRALALLRFRVALGLP
jgi:hypothetical protein